MSIKFAPFSDILVKAGSTTPIDPEVALGGLVQAEETYLYAHGWTKEGCLWYPKPEAEISQLEGLEPNDRFDRNQAVLLTKTFYGIK
jgi:hypothetical protein